jgi:hypothetical protein
MRLGVQATASIRIKNSEGVNGRSGIEKTLGPKAKAPTRAFCERNSQGVNQGLYCTNAFSCLHPQVPASALPAEAIMNSNRFKQSGLSGPALSNEKHNWLANFDFTKRSNGWHTERILLPVFHSI